MNTKTKPTSKNQARDKLFDSAVECCFMYFDICKQALKTDSFTKKENIALFLSLLSLSWALVYKDQHLYILKSFSFEIFHSAIDNVSYKLGIAWELTIATVSLILVTLFAIGYGPFIILKKYQKGIDRLSLKSGLNEKPRVLKVEHLSENRSRLLVKSEGLGQERYQSKLDDLRASVGQMVESIKYLEHDNTCVEIFLASRPLEHLVKYEDAIAKLRSSYSFVVGKSLGGIITQSIVDLPHLMIGGTSGGGKSNALNNVLVNLLESSNNLQMYLIDLKGGLEIKAYESLKNVSLVRDIPESVMTLKFLVDEMERRYKFLESIGKKKIDPKRDSLNRIVIAIDECTDLLGKVPRTHSDYQHINQAIEHCDKLARKARACGIHIVLATQKIDQSSIPTRIQENMNGRIAVKTNTPENSMRLLGNNKASKLSDISGRAIWSIGSTFTEVQIPLIKDDEIDIRIANLKIAIESKQKSHFTLLDSTSVSKEETTKEQNTYVVEDADTGGEKDD